MTSQIKTRTTNTVRLKTHIRSAAWIGPERVFRHIAPLAGLVWFDSGMDISSAGQWSYIMWEPDITIQGAKDRFTITEKNDLRKYQGDPFILINRLLSQYKIVHTPSSPPFTGGAAGFFGYGLLSHCEPSTRLAKTDSSPEGDLWLGFYNDLIAFNHVSRETFLVVNIDEAKDPATRFARMETVMKKAENDYNNTRNNSTIHTDIKSNFSRNKYIESVERVRSYIEAGDCYQVNISQRFTASGKFDPVSLYLKLRAISPAPFAAYVDTGNVQVLSSSPERFVRLSGGIAQTRPIKGTRPRGTRPEDDERLRTELETSEKDRAENIMIVDLMRNDLSKVCLPNSVKASSICEVERFPTLYHLTSMIEGKILPGVGAVDLLKHSFPAGSVTGAPKIRAMEIIDELEPAPRGIYCGAIGYLGYNGSMDTSVAIRVMVVTGETLSFNVGGAVTYPSDPEAEYQETLDKAKAMMEAVGK